MKIELKPRTDGGRLLVFEGTDGAGKTTMIRMTRDYLSERIGAENVLVTKQPTEMSRRTKLFQKMMYCKKQGEVDYRAVQLLTLSDRIQHGFEEIEPALAAGKTVICDRYVYTSVANMLARGYRNETWFFEAAKHLAAPDAVFLAHVPPALALQRIKERPEEAARHLDEALLRRVSAEFAAMSEENGFVLLDTSGDAEKAFARVRRALGGEAVA